jgi:hypothetical protein
MRSTTSAPHRTISKPVEVGSAEDELVLQPWFLSKSTYAAVRRLLPPSQMLKMRYYFEDYGCLKCGNLNALYCSNGLCRGCSVTIRCRLALALKRRFRKLGVKIPKGPIDRYLRVFDRKPGCRP